MQTEPTQKKRPTSVASVPAVFCILLVLLVCLILAATGFDHAPLNPSEDVYISDRFNTLVSDAMTQAENAALSVPKKFWLDEDTLIAPVPDPEKFGSTDDPTSLQWLLDDAADVLEGQSTLFSTDIKLLPRSQVMYYLDDTIFAVTWKQGISKTAYTISEIKVKDPSQFRRYLADGTYENPKRYAPSTMARTVNAVVGSSADHYLGRRRGIIVYDGEVKRVDDADKVDICYVDDKGNLIFTHRGDLTGMEDAQAFVDKHNIQFSMAFGPILVENGQRCEPDRYLLGETNDNYARAALCQLDELHYLVVTANAEPGYVHSPNIHSFAEVISSFGPRMAYTLDGGNTGAIVMNGKLINKTPFGYERIQGDIIYFCTAIPNT